LERAILSTLIRQETAMSDVTTIRNPDTESLLTLAHESAMQRMIQAGATPISVLGLACELQRDWGRPEENRLRVIMGEYFSKLKALKG
jgi:hypothetical protein